VGKGRNDTSNLIDDDGTIVEEDSLQHNNQMGSPNLSDGASISDVDSESSLENSAHGPRSVVSSATDDEISFCDGSDSEGYEDVDEFDPCAPSIKTYCNVPDLTAVLWRDLTSPKRLNIRNHVQVLTQLSTTRQTSMEQQSMVKTASH
jgi:hypothetical protein